MPNSLCLSNPRAASLRHFFPKTLAAEGCYKKYFILQSLLACVPYLRSKLSSHSVVGQLFAQLAESQLIKTTYSKK